MYEKERKRIFELRAANKKIVFTNGCFDLLHVGHLRLLEAAKALGDKLVVGLNSDASVSHLKGENRPVVPENERREMLLGLKPVDEVYIFSEDTPLELIKALEPDVLAKGGDWSEKDIVGSDIVLSRGGQVKSLLYLEGHSTSELIAKGSP